MKTNHGKVLEEAIYKSGIKKIELAKKLGITRQTLSNKINTHNLPLDFLLRVGKIIGFSSLPSELEVFHKQQVAQEEAENYKKSDDSSDWKDKYLNLLEDYKNMSDSSQLTIASLTKLIKPSKR